MPAGSQKHDCGGCREAALLPLSRLCRQRVPCIQSQAGSIAAVLMHRYQVSGTAKLSASVKGAVLETLGSLLEAKPEVPTTTCLWMT